jgi:hypothetical protein
MLLNIFDVEKKLFTLIISLNFFLMDNFCQFKGEARGGKGGCISTMIFFQKEKSNFIKFKINFFQHII